MKTKLDYLRLGSWSDKFYTDMHLYFRNKFVTGWKARNWLQYTGSGVDGIFIGRAKQKRLNHHILTISGESADQLYKGLLEQRAYATRLDFQRTIVAPELHMLPDVKSRCKRKCVTLIDGYENDTLYLGARTSDLFTRLYEKILDETYLRLEIELKGDRSRACWTALQDGVSPDGIYEKLLTRLGLPDDIVSLFEDSTVTPTDHLLREKLKIDSRKRLEWLKRMDSAVKDSIANHEIGDQVKQMVRDWCEYANYLDKISTIE